MLESALDEAYRDKLLVLLSMILLAIPLAQLFILHKILVNNNTSVRG